MSVKRAATTDLNHDNWDQEDPSEHEEMGSFKPAAKDVIEKRVIRTAKRRAHTQNISLTGSQGTSDEPKKTVFSGFGGFNKTQPSSFDFLANLTNGNKNSSPSTSKIDTTVTSTIFGNAALPTKPSNGLFGLQASTESTQKTMFGIPSAQTSSSLFGNTTTTTASPIFTASKADTSVRASPFNVQHLTSTSNNAIKTPDVKTDSGPQISSTVFGGPSINQTSKLFTDSSKQTIFGNNSISTAKPAVSNSGSLFTTGSNSNKVTPAMEKKEKEDDKKLTYYTKLKGLNLSVSDWIKKHVEEMPICILTPIFRDYEKHLKEMQDEYKGESKTSEDKTNDATLSEQTSTPPKSTSFSLGSNTKLSTPQSTAFSMGSNTKLSTPTAGGFSLGNNTKLSSSDNTPVSTGLEQTKSGLYGTGTSLPQPSCPPGANLFSTATNTGLNGGGSFSFGIAKNTTSPTAEADVTKKNIFGIATSPQTSSASSTSPFSTNTNGTASLSFPIGKPFSFSAEVQKAQAATTEASNENEDEDSPPKVEYKPIVEENSVYEKRCKVFVKKDGTYADKGIGTLYIKKIESNGKHQLLVRANTSLGNVLINLILASAIPLQRMGKNNVMMVCIPTPESKPPPVPMLIRVKTPEEADELLETLNKYKT